MAATTKHQQPHVGTAGEGLAGAISSRDGQPMEARLTTDQVWRVLSKASFAILGHVTPRGEPRSSGVVYQIAGRRLYIAVAPDSWKAKHVAATGRVAVTVPLRRGGILSLVAPIPPATVSFHAMAIVHPAGSPQARSLVRALGSLVPAERQAIASIIEVVPEGEFVTYAVGIPLRNMRDPAKARGRVPVSQEGGTR